MKTPIIIDACSLINLLRIDEEDNFLYKHLKSLDIHIAETVYNEFKTNILRNAIDKSDEHRLEMLLPLPLYEFYYHKDDEIIDYFEQEEIEDIKKFVGHDKKENGELISSLLSLQLSREKKEKVCFYTDDYPAKVEFGKLFYLLQIGSLKDSVDLLFLLYWINDIFTISKLRSLLHNLKSEYNKVIGNFVKQITEIKSEYGIKDHNWKKIDAIEYAFYKNDMIKFGTYVDELRNTKDKKIKKILKSFPYLSEQPKIADKIDCVMRNLEMIDITSFEKYDFNS